MTTAVHWKTPPCIQEQLDLPTAAQARRQTKQPRVLGACVLSSYSGPHRTVNAVKYKTFHSLLLPEALILNNLSLSTCHIPTCSPAYIFPKKLISEWPQVGLRCRKVGMGPSETSLLLRLAEKTDPKLNE